MKLGDKMRELRLKNNLTQKQLADKMHVTQGYISLIEHNLTVPRPLYVELFCVILGVKKTEKNRMLLRCKNVVDG